MEERKEGGEGQKSQNKIASSFAMYVILCIDFINIVDNVKVGNLKNEFRLMKTSC
jgi:hypothetical protein